VQALAADIGSRRSGSEEEAEAARYIREQLKLYGYDTTVQEFSFDAFFDAGTTLQLTAPESSAIDATTFEPSISGLAEGGLVAAGLGRPQEFPAETVGKIALIERGQLFFSDKAANAAAAGAIAAIVYNNEPGPLNGTMPEESPIPIAGISRDDGLRLLSLLASGPVAVSLDVRATSGSHPSQNIVARPPEGQCQVIVGGHYDSVPAGPGANDNASGTATTLEIARVLAADGEFDDVCFILFGAEEVGLFGSREFVSSLSTDERREVRGMLNFDMVGVGADWLLAGSAALSDLAAEEADGLGLAYQISTNLPADLGSDHASFLQAGIPAIIFHRLGDPHYHTAEDAAEFVQKNRLAEIGALGLAVIEALIEGQ
jgi:aminopeptidase YwaD